VTAARDGAAVRLLIRAAASARALLDNADDPAAIDRAKSVLDAALDAVAPAHGAGDETPAPGNVRPLR